MKEFERKEGMTINLIPSKKMFDEARERVSRALKLTHEHTEESKAGPLSPFERKGLK